MALYSVALYSVADDRDGKHLVKYRLMNGGDHPIDNVVLLVANRERKASTWLANAAPLGRSSSALAAEGDTRG